MAAEKNNAAAAAGVIGEVNAIVGEVGMVAPEEDAGGGEQPSQVTEKPWSAEEDEALRRLVLRRGADNWPAIAGEMPGRTGDSCRLRWEQLPPPLPSPARELVELELLPMNTAAAYDDGAAAAYGRGMHVGADDPLTELRLGPPPLQAV